MTIWESRGQKAMNEINTTAPSLSDLRLVRAKDFRAERTGRFYLSSNGKRKEETVGVEYFHTAGAGCLRSDVW